MKLLSFALTCLLLVGLTSCAFLQEKVIPQTKQKAADAITKAIVKTGECKAVEMVQSDVEKLLKIESDDSMVVKALGSTAPEGSQQESIISQICKSAASLALPTLLQKGVPEKWECQLIDLGGKIGELADQACGKIPI